MPEKTDSPFPARSGRTTSPASAERQLKGFIDKFEPRHKTLIRAARKAMRRRLPTAFELAYDNYNFFVLGYGPTARPSDRIVSLAASASGLNLFFLHGTRLTDPKKVLLAKTPFSARTPGSLIMRSVSARQRPRRRDA